MFYWLFYKKHFNENTNLRKPIWVLSIINLLLGMTAIVFAYFSKYTLDAILSSELNTFYLGASLLVLTIVFQFIFKVFYQYYSIKQQTILHKNLQAKYFESLLHTKLPIINSRHKGVWMNMLDSDVTRLSTGLLEILPRFIFMITRFVFAFVLLLFLDTIIAITISALGLSLIVVGTLLRNEMKRRHHLRQDAESSVREYLQEQLSHPEIIKAFRAEDHTIEQLGARQQKYAEAKVYQKKLTIIFGTVLQALFMLIYASVLAFGAYRISIGLLTVGSLVAILQLVEYMQSPFRLANSLLPKFSAMEASHERLENIAKLPQELKQSSKKETFHTISANDICFGYNDNPEIISHLDFSIKTGQVVQITGSSGIGKTTMLYILLGLLDPISGSIHLNGKTNIPVNSNSREFFTYVPQQLNLMSGTIKENILYARTNISESKIIEVCRSCQIHDDIISLPKGYDSIIGENGIGLSEGQLQRLALARALIGDEPILLLDEVTSALDHTTEAALLKTIRSLKNKTIFIVSHRTLPDYMIDQIIHI